jgi:glycyl-tRNA synthetase
MSEPKSAPKKPAAVSMDKLVSLCKRRGFIFPSSEIYGGFAGVWDFGPLGVELKNNIKRAWWEDFVYARTDMVGLDAAILASPRVWEASGHVQNFTDPLAECRNCHRRFKADDIDLERPCPVCGKKDWTDVRLFNTMFKTFVGPVEDEASIAYLRVETCQAIFVNFRLVQQAMRKKLPFGIAQIGKAFRNEITVENFIFRLRELEQMEIEYFVRPEQADSAFEDWVETSLAWLTRHGVRRDMLTLHEHPPEERAFYSRRTVDIQYRFPFGTKELQGIANRGDYDLTQHMRASGKDLEYFDDETNEHLVPYVIEPSIGVERPLLAFLLEAYAEEPDKDGIRTVLRLHPRLAPVKVAVLPLVRRDEALVKMAQDVYAGLRGEMLVQYDDTGTIGRRYRRQDEIGTPWCVTIDQRSLEQGEVTIRDRDSTEQVYVPADGLRDEIQRRLRQPWQRP